MALPSPFELAATALQSPIETVKPDSGLNRHPKWDSMGHLEIMMALEQHYGVEITDATVRQFQTMAEIVARYEAIKGHG
jgi:acyl carrier protein